MHFLFRIPLYCMYHPRVLLTYIKQMLETSRVNCSYCPLSNNRGSCLTFWLTSNRLRLNGVSQNITSIKLTVYRIFQFGDFTSYSFWKVFLVEIISIAAVSFSQHCLLIQESIFEVTSLLEKKRKKSEFCCGFQNEI